MAERVGVYAGSFDPFTRGHEDIVRRALHVVDRVVLAVAVNSAKNSLFTLAERTRLAQEVMTSERVEVRELSGLLVDFARGVGATILVRGVRGVTDFDYEQQMVRMNRELAPELETVILTPAADVAHVSSTFVREIARLGGDVSRVVHPAVAAALRERLAR